MDEYTRANQRQAVTGDLDAQIKVLVDRARQSPQQWSWRGTRGRFELAGYCGHRPSRRILGWPPEDGHNHGGVFVPSQDPCVSVDTSVVCCYCAEFPEWVLGLGSWGQEACVRALIAVADHTIPYWALAMASTDTIPHHLDPTRNEAAFAAQVEFRARTPKKAIQLARQWVDTKDPRVLDSMTRLRDYTHWLYVLFIEAFLSFHMPYSDSDIRNLIDRFADWSTRDKCREAIQGELIGWALNE